MGCLLILLSFFTPRLVIVLLWLFSGYLAAAYTTAIWPVLGFFFMPYTTLAYAVGMNNGGIAGAWMALVIVAVLFDLGTMGGGGAAAKRRR